MTSMCRTGFISVALLLVCIGLPYRGSADPALPAPAANPSTDVSAQDSDGNTALIRAAKIADVAEVKRHIAAGADVNAKNNQSQTALMFAALSGQIDCVKALIAAGADVNAASNNADTALSVAKGDDVAAALKAAGAK